jgi:Predicted thiol oxidoreductase
MMTAAVLVLGGALPAAADNLDAAIGKALFERNWLPAPASTAADDGLGPLFNARSCAGCHHRAGPADLRRTADGVLHTRGFVVRFATADGGPDPFYGHQLQDRAVPGLASEGRLTVAAAGDENGPLHWSMTLVGPPLAVGVRSGLRLAPSLVGRAELARIDAAAILAAADPDDRDGDGISGRARIVSRKGGRPEPGRFGWKASVADLPAQVALAFALDMGLSSRGAPLPYGDCTPAEAACLAAPTGLKAGDAGQELSDAIITLLADFLATRRASPLPEDSKAMRLFSEVGCAACHRPTMPDVSGRPVRTFTDLLLHDMGPELDGGVGEPGAASAEWRTAPLADLDRRDGRRRYLHDGRAATVDAAIAAHGGEAAAARARYAALTSADRTTLLRLIEGL